MARKLIERAIKKIEEKQALESFVEEREARRERMDRWEERNIRGR